MKKLILKNITKLMLCSVFWVGGSLGQASTDLVEAASETGYAGSYLASRTAMSDNDDEAAVVFLERAHSLDNENVDLSYELFTALVTNGQVEEAAEIAKRITEHGKANSLASLVMAAEAIKERSWKTVPEILKQIEGADLDSTLKSVSLAWALQGEGKTKESLELLDAIEGPEWVTLIKNYHGGLIAAVNGDDEVSITKLQAVIDNQVLISVLTETYLRAVEALARIQSKAEDKKAAKLTLDYGLTLFPNHAPFVDLELALKKGDFLDPMLSTPQEGMAELFYNLATAIHQDGGENVAKAYLQVANYLNPKGNVIKMALAEIYLLQSNYAKSNVFYAQIPENSSFYYSSRFEMANNMARLDQKKEAISELKALIKVNSDDLTGYMSLGRLYSREMRFKEAVEIYDKAMAKLDEIKPQQWNLFYLRGMAYERLKIWDKAEADLKKSLELSKDQPEVLNYLGYSWIDQGVNLEEGMEMIRKAIELRPRAGNIVDSLGWAHYRLGEYEDAVTELEKAAELLPQNSIINDHLGDAYWQVGRKLEATFQWKIALFSEDEAENPELIKKKLSEGLVDSTKIEAKVE